MKRFIAYMLALAVALVPAAAAAQSRPTVNAKDVNATGDVNIGGDLNLPSKSANQVFAAPSSGSGAPSFRTLAADDIPSIDAGKIATGLVPVARGGTGVSTSTGTGATVRNTDPAFAGALTGETSTFVKAVSPTGDGANSVWRNSAMSAFDIYSPMVPPGYFFWANNRSVLNNQPGINLMHTSAYDAYTLNNVATGVAPLANGAVGLFVDGVNAATGATTWGLNTSCGDSIDNTIGNSKASTCVGYEIDFTVYNVGTLVEALPMIIQGVVGAASANGPHLSIAPGSTTKWTNGYLTDNGAVTGSAVKIGANAVSGANIPSQPIAMGYFDAGSVNHDLKLQANGSALNITSTSTGDGIALQTTTGNQRLVAFGSSTDININYDAKGVGSHVFNKGASFAGNVSSTGSLSATTSVSGASVTATTVAGNTSVTSPKYINSTALPTPSTCGTSPTVAAGSGNNAGKFTLGSGTVTACTISFANGYSSNSFCTLTPASNYTGTFYISGQSNSGFIMTTSANAAGQSFNYTCFGN